MNEKRKFVASRQPFDSGQTIAMFGSNNLCVSSMQAGLIDELQIKVNLVVFGAGTTLFSGLPKKAGLALTDTCSFKSGAVLLTYKPAEG